MEISSTLAPLTLTGKKVLRIIEAARGAISSKKIKQSIAEHFDEEFYKEHYSNRLGSKDALSHYLECGWKEGHDPTPWFSTSKYLEAYPDVAASGVNPFFHYLQYGEAEGRHEGLNQEHVSGSPRSLVQGRNEVDENYLSSEYFKQATDILGNKSTFTDAAFEQFADWARQVPKATGTHPNVKAFLDGAQATGTGKEAFVHGWVIRRPESFVWFETNRGQILPMRSAFFQYREDVYRAFEEEMTDAIPNTGFVQSLTSCDPDTDLKVFALSSKGAHQIAQCRVERIGAAPKKLAEALFAIPTPLSKLSERIGKIDAPLLNSLIEHKNRSNAAMPHETYTFGTCAEPKVSVIVPLYGRIDFVEAQMQTFAADNFFKQNVQLIYVIDDPGLVEPFKKLSQDIYKLYKVPFTVVWGGVNRGFSGANNLGAEYANAEYLLFLNSDAFPTRAGWVEDLLEVIQRSNDYGVVSPRLLFADGSIQHGGMEFVYRHDLAIWTNHHPRMGTEPELDIHKEPTVVPAVTGACMLMSRETFNNIDGWDEGYLVGDFEDSDLCFKLRASGKSCVYVPTVELTHLERQSFNLTGEPDFRTKVVIFNATKHQNKWSTLLEQSEAQV